MMRILNLRIFLASFALGLAVSCASAQENPAGAAQAVTQVVQSQLMAFSEDDAEKAFSLATSATQNMAGTPTEFLYVIKRRFSPIYRHRHALFSDPEIIGGSALQVVQLTDHENFVWIAIYQVEREPDGTWKVDGCQLFETDDLST